MRTISITVLMMRIQKLFFIVVSTYFVIYMTNCKTGIKQILIEDKPGPGQAA